MRTQTRYEISRNHRSVVQYVKPFRFRVGGNTLSMQDWLRQEWHRSGLTWRSSNEACGVLNAATRKYLTADHLWYYPPPEAFEKLATYANAHGRPEGRPYFSIHGNRPVTAAEWAKLRAKFNCSVGITNVWQHPRVSGLERINRTRQRKLNRECVSAEIIPEFYEAAANRLQFAV